MTSDPTVTGMPEEMTDGGIASTEGKSKLLNSTQAGATDMDLLTPAQNLYVKKNVLNRSLAVLRFAVIADAVNTTILQPNYPIMASPGAHPVSRAGRTNREEWIDGLLFFFLSIQHSCNSDCSSHNILSAYLRRILFLLLVASASARLHISCP